MPLRIATLVLDATDLSRAARFWSHALGYKVTDESATWVSLDDPAGRGLSLALQPRDDKKADVNRLHMDLAAADVQAEVKRLESLGATRAKWPYYTSATPSFVVMLDPEGNEFCVVPS